MRNVIQIVSVFLAAVIIFQGGASAGPRWEAGLKGGLNLAELRGDQIGLWLGGEDSQLSGTIGDTKVGFDGGIFLTAFFNDFVGLQAEMLYVQKGGEGTATGYTVFYPPNDIPRAAFFNGTVSVDLDYIEIPVMAVFDFEATEGGTISLRGLAGATFGFNINAEANLNGTAEITMQDTSTRTYQIDERTEIGDRVKNFEFGLIFGGALYWDIGNIDIVFEARWERGLTTLDNTTLYRDVQTSNINTLIGISVPLGGR